MENDFLFLTGIMFEYRKNRNYNDTIMKVINKALELMDRQSDDSTQVQTIQQQTNYQDF